MSPYEKAVSEVVELLDSNGINYTLDAGTLLKSYRGDDIFDDFDFDIAIFNPNIELVKNLIDGIRRSGLRVRCQGNLPFFEDLVQIEVDLLNGTYSYIDIYLYFKSGDEYVRRCIHKPLPASKLSVFLYRIFSKMYRNSGKSQSILGSLVWLFPYALRRVFGDFFIGIYKRFALTVWNVVPVNIIGNCKKKVINNIEFSVLENAEKYLYQRYGATWKIPDPYWNFSECEVYRIRNPYATPMTGYWIDCDTFDLVIEKRRSEPLFSYSSEEIARIYAMDKKAKSPQ